MATVAGGVEALPPKAQPGPGLTLELPSMPALKTVSDHQSLWGDTYRRYAEWNGRDGEQLFIDQTRKLATELYQQTAAIAPSKAEIEADVKAQGWHIPEKFDDGRQGRGKSSQWLGLVLATREKRRGRKSNGQRQSEDAFLRGRATLEQMQAYVIKLRTSARLYLASGWLGAIFDLGGTLKASSGKVDSERGGAEIRRSPGLLEITLWNRTPGIAAMNAKHQLVARALAVRTADMWVYIRRKMDEAAMQILKAA